MKINFKTFSASLLSSLFMMTSFVALAQDNVGVGTTTPHENSILDVSSTDKGILVPRLNTLQRLGVNPTAGADGLLVYDTDLDEFCYWDGTQWICYPGAGSAGATGPQGPAGPAGPAGGVGPAGPTGPAGPAGADGATGPQGVQGIQGPQGPAGPAGAAGAQGPAGVQGPAGPAGADGATGPQGAQGIQGPQGPAGPAGATGAQGPAGPQGPQGPQGPSATSTFASVSLAANAEISSTGYANVPGMSVSFTATGTQAYLNFTASGYGYTNSMSFVSFRVQRNTTTVAKTNTKIQSYDDVTGTITPWSCASSVLMTGLTSGTNYTINVQALVGGIDGTWNAVINPALDGHHMCVTVLQ